MTDPPSEEETSQEDVLNRIADLAERQATSTQLPRLSSGPLASSPEAKRVSSIKIKDGLSNDEDDDRPKLDEAAIKELVTEAGESSRPRLESHLSNDSSTSRKTLQRLTSSGSSSLPITKRMTVLEDEEGPVERNEEADSGLGGSEGEEGHDNIGAAELRGGDVVEIEDPGIYERDADEGDGEGVEMNADDNGQTSTDKPLMEASEEEAPRLMDSIATLRALHSSTSLDDNIGAGESSNDQQDGIDSDDEEPTLKYSRLKGSVPDVLKKDSASALAVSDRVLALGTHSGAIYILDEQGNLVKGFRSHTASVMDLVIDSTSEFIGSAGMDGIVSISSLSSSEAYTFDFKRVMRTIALEPAFGRRSTRSFVCGGMAGQLVLREKNWFGHRETIIHEGEGPIWTTKWKGNLIAWVTDRGIRIYDVQSRQRIGLISPPLDNPRADLFRCSLVWQDDFTLLIAWADHVKVAKMRQRKKKQNTTPAATNASSFQLHVEVTAILQLDCMISGIAARGKDYLILAYITEDTYSDDSSIVNDREAQRRKDGQRPELRLISNDGDELSSDVLSLESFARFQCNDYLLVPSADSILTAANALKGSQANDDSNGDYFYVVSPKDVVIARSRDEKDHIEWLLQHTMYQEALASVKAMDVKKVATLGFDLDVIGRQFLAHLIQVKQDFEKAAQVAPSIIKNNNKAWEDLIFAFVEKNQLHHIISVVPIEDPILSGVVYDMILAHFLRYNLHLLYETVKRWPPEIYSIKAVVLAIEDRLKMEKGNKKLLMECLAEVFIKNRQPGKALPFFLRLRKPGVFDLIREHNLFTVVQDQALLLIEFEEDNKQGDKMSKHGAAIDLLVDHTHSIPIHRVVSQLQGHTKYLYMYLDALFDRDPAQVATYSDIQVNLYSDFEYIKLMPYLRAMSSHYSFEKAYNTCKEHDYVPEMVFLLSRIGDNKTALTLIIERLQDVERAIEFVKEEKDADLWEDLIRYSENRPKFIKGLLENVGSEVDAVKLIKRIRNGLEIQGLKKALIKILQDFNLQISLLEGCEAILYNNVKMVSYHLHQGQSIGQYCDKDTSQCDTCHCLLLDKSISPTLDINNVVFLCRHAHHLSCLIQNIESIPKMKSSAIDSKSIANPLKMNTTQALASGKQHTNGSFGPKLRAIQFHQEEEDHLRYQNKLKVVLKRGCPICIDEGHTFSH